MPCAVCPVATVLQLFLDRYRDRSTLYMGVYSRPYWFIPYGRAYSQRSVAVGIAAAGAVR